MVKYSFIYPKIEGCSECPISEYHVNDSGNVCYRCVISDKEYYGDMNYIPEECPLTKCE